jgi:hypothetical protein
VSLHINLEEGLTADASLMSLKNHGADESVDGMFELGSEIMALPMEEKMKFEQGDDGVSFG